MPIGLKFSRGQTITEYVLLGSVIVLLTIPAWPMFAQALGSLLAMHMANVKGQSLWPESKGPGTIHFIPDAKNPITGMATITLPDGELIYLNGFIIDSAQSVETVGANGTSDLIAELIEKLARELLAKGEITALQANKLFDLANQLHRIAKMQAIVENSMGSMSDDQSPHLTGPVYFDGEKYDSLWELASQFGITGLNTDKYGQTPVLGAAGDGHASNGVETQEFLDLYLSAKESGALNNPAADKIVGSLVSEAYWAAESLESSTFFTPQMYPPSEMRNKLNENYSKQMDQPLVIDSNTTISSMDAMGICTTGGGLDNGTFCSPAPVTVEQTP